MDRQTGATKLREKGCSAHWALLSPSSPPGWREPDQPGRAGLWVPCSHHVVKVPLPSWVIDVAFCPAPNPHPLIFYFEAPSTAERIHSVS